MKFEDISQNLGARIITIQVIVFVLLTVLGVRLYYLQIVKGEQYATRAEEQRIRLLPIPAKRGAILDRNGKILVDSRSTYNLILSRDALKNKDSSVFVKPFADGLDLDAEVLQDKLDVARTQQDFDSIVVKENASMNDIAWVESHSLEFAELRVELQPQRRYPLGATLSHVVGYVGEISKKQLEDPKYKDRGLKSGDVIGKDGLESTYDENLRGRDGYRKVVVDSRSRVREELETVEPQPGQDLITTIDLDLQISAEEQLAKSATKRGVIIVTDPNNGEILAMASAPNYDPNVFALQSSTKEGRAAIAKLYNDPEKPLLNRATRGRYYPGSTWKIPMSAAALEQGVISVEKSNVLCGGGIQIGNKFTRCMGSHGSPALPYAITKSCDGYYYHLALKMKPEGLIKMVEEFEYDKKTGVDLPNELTSRTPKYFKPIREKNSRWTDLDTVFSSIGQVYVEATPISMIRAVTSIAVGGKMFVPHFMKELKSVNSIGEPGTAGFIPSRAEIAFSKTEPKIIPITPEQNKLILDGMWGVVNNGGTAARVKMTEWEIAGKTGTAQVVGLGKDVGKLKDHSWFVSFAPASKPEIAVICLIENAGFGAQHAAPAVKGVYETYLRKKGIIVESDATTAKVISKR
ncbi:MAG: penicillin-binding protein 2 [Pyrinomonadaceae bacterium]|nr:penicillin-binding protein 2 [Pyrinomonadaceae bacterium]